MCDSRTSRCLREPAARLLGVVGGECAGALHLWPQDVVPPTTAAYDPVTEATLTTAFASADGQLRQVMGRASLSGAQPKLVLYDAEGTVRLAPAYDVVVTTLFAGLDQTFALAFGGTTHPAALTPQRLRSVAREFDVALPQVTALAADVLERVRGAPPIGAARRARAGR